ncbi:MAG: response regulator [Deltaproteobacteria bacterium]|nr:response regulator [Deltaproteobacteria bacterium]
MSMQRLRGIHILCIHLACAALCAASVYFFLPRMQYALFRDFVRERQRTVCRIVAGELNNTFEKAKLLLKAEANSSDVIRAVQGTHGVHVVSDRFDTLTRLFEGMDAYRAPALDFLLLNAQGDIIAGSGADKGDRSMAPYFASAMQGTFYMRVLGVAARTGGPALRVAEPVLSGGVPVGVLALTLDLGKITGGWRRHLEDASRLVVFLVDDNGKILVRSDMAASGMALDDAEPLPRGAPGECVTTERTRDGGTRMLTHLELPLTGWTVIVSGAAEAMFTGEGAGGGFAALVFAAAFLALLLVVCVPLQAVFNAMRRKAITHGQQALLLQSLEDGIIALGADGVVSYMNSAAESIVRAPKDLLTGSHVHSGFRFRRFDEHSAAREGSPLLPHLTEGSGAHFRGQLLWRADGSCFVGDVSLYPLDTEAQPRLFMLRLRDVTDERDAEELMRAVYRVADKLFLEWDEHLQPLDCTEECIRLFGANDAQDLLDDFFFRFFPAVQPDGAFSAHAGAQALKRALEQGFCRLVWRCRTQEGTLLPCEITLIRRLRGGRPGILGHVRDLRPLLASVPQDARQARQRASIDAMPVGMGIMVAGQCRFANPALRAMTGMQAGETAPALLLDALGPSGTDAAFAVRAQGGHLCLPRPDGGTGDFLLAAAPVEYEGESGVVCCLADISGQKRLERELIAARDAAEAAASARGRFLAMMSHEVRTPLNGIMGILQLASMQEMDVELEEHLDTAFSLCRNLLQVLSDILDFSKIESGSLTIQAEEFSLATAVHTALVALQDAVRGKSIELRCTMDPALPAKLLGDMGRVHQLLLNLVGNAVKYTQEGQVELEVLRLPALGPAALRVLFAVSDTGVGISAARMDGIFDPFRRGDDSYVLRQSGVGLGLAIVRRLVQLMDGELCMFSREGQGTENHLILSFALPAAVETLPDDAGADEDAPGWGETDYCAWSADTPRILVVDDEGTNLMTMQFLLGALGYPADVAESGTRALQMLRERRYALVFMDIQMPGMSGYEATAAIRAAPELAFLPIVALTAHAMHGDKEQMLSRGFDEYMAKPVIISDLKKLLRRLLAFS